jgi:hypothetical protein
VPIAKAATAAKPSRLIPKGLIQGLFAAINIANLILCIGMPEAVGHCSGGYATSTRAIPAEMYEHWPIILSICCVLPVPAVNGGTFNRTGRPEPDAMYLLNPQS